MTERLTTTGVIQSITFIEGDHHSGSGWYVFVIDGIRHSSTSDRWLEVRKGDSVSFTHGGPSGRVVIKSHDRKRQ